MSKPYCGGMIFAVPNPSRSPSFYYHYENFCVPPVGMPNQFYQFWQENAAPVLLQQVLEGRCQQLGCDMKESERMTARSYNIDNTF